MGVVHGLVGRMALLWNEIKSSQLSGLSFLFGNQFNVNVTLAITCVMY